MAGREREPGDRQEASGDGEGFLGRWSRRKAEAKTADQPLPADPAELDDADAGETAPANREPDEPPGFDVASLPDIDSLGPGSDFSMFMQTGVPPALKTRALRKLWRVKPELANLDGLLDYGEDLTGSFKVVDHLKTAYEVGRGFLRDQDGEVLEEGERDENEEIEGQDGVDSAIAYADSAKARETDRIAGRERDDESGDETAGRDGKTGSETAKG